MKLGVVPYRDTYCTVATVSWYVSYHDYILGQMHIFRFLQKYLMGFKPCNFITELSISHFYCVLRTIVLLEDKPSARLRFWMLWTGFSLRLSQYFGALRFSSTLTSPSLPAAEKQPHSMRLLPAHFTFGMVLCRWWAVPGFLQTWCLELSFFRLWSLSFYRFFPSADMIMELN